MSARILFVCYGSGHVNALLPVILKLRRQHPKIGIDVLGLTTAGPKLAAMGVPYLGFKDFVQPEDEPALALGRRLAADLPGKSQVDDRETVAYLGINYQELVDDLGPSGAADEYASHGRMAFLPVRMMDRIVERLRPDLVVATHAPRAERAAIMVARKRAIPALCLGDLFLSFEVEWMRANDYADRVLVLNQFVKDRLVAAGRNPDHVVVTGNPAFDQLAAPAWKALGSRIRETRGWTDRKVVLWISQAMPWDPDGGRAICETLIAAAAKHPEWRLVLRTHPNEGPIRWEVPDFVDRSSPLEDPPPAILNATDVGVTMFSTMGLEAVLLGVPMVSTAIPPPIPSSFIDFDRENFLRGMNLAVVATRLEDIEPAIARALSERPDHRSKLPPLGNATDAVISEIEDFLPRTD